MSALRASVGNSDAIAALALVELSLAQPLSFRSRLDLHVLIDKWGRALKGVDPVEVERLKRQIKEIANLVPGDFDTALDFLTRGRAARH